MLWQRAHVRRTVQELEPRAAAASPSRTFAAQAYGQPNALISLDEGVGKMKAALMGVSDPSLLIIAATGAPRLRPDDAIARAKLYDAVGGDHCSLPV